ncbi:MAG: hypothetical protein GY696_03725, partial [Gammaproteobacteria bacterium]|nr:hypothetical protein [Gammaproteobacteria bacterium]
MVKFAIHLKNGETQVIQANVIPEVTSQLRRPPITRADIMYLEKTISMADSIPKKEECESIDLLIGLDHYHDILDFTRLKVQEGLYLQGSKLGWILTERIKEDENGVSRNENVTSQDTPSLLIIDHANLAEPLLMNQSREKFSQDKKVEDLWNLDVIGIKDSLDESDDEKAMEQFAESVEFKDKRYYVGWPWKYPTPERPENRELAFGRFQALLRKTKNNPKLLSKLNSIIEEQERLGIIEKVTPEVEEGARKHYIP